MVNFDKIIKQKIEQFDVPFNDAHWSEMETKLNKASAKKSKKLFLGSTVTIMTLTVAAFLLFYSNTTIELNSKENVLLEKLSNNSVEINLPKSSAVKKNEILIDEKLSIPKIVTTKESSQIAPPNHIVKTKKSISPIITREKQKTKITEVIQEKSSIQENNLETNTTELLPVEKPTIVRSTEETRNKSKAKTTESVAPVRVNIDKIKNNKHKVYKDDHISKKSIKRTRRGFFRFFSFRKKRYKVPLSKKLSSTKIEK